MAKLDILMPVRDAAPWVGSAWRSLVRQTFPDWRLVAVDDGSGDGSVEVLLAAADGDSRLALLEQPATGVAAALNRGLGAVSAPVVARMDADDVCHPRRLELLYGELARHPQLGVVGSRVRLFPGRAVTPAMGAYLAWQNGLLENGQLWRERYVECTLTHATAAFRTEVLETAGGWWEGDGPEDLDLFLRLHREGVRFAKRPEVLYLWREHPSRETRTSRRMTIAAFRATKIRHLDRELRALGQDQVALFGVGDSLEEWRNGLNQLGLQVTAREIRTRGPVPEWDGVGVFCFGNPVARDRLRVALTGREEGRDYLFVA